MLTGHCGRNCNAHQGHERCAACPGRAASRIALQRLAFPLTLLASLAFAALLAGCGGGDPEDHADGHKDIDPPACSASGVCQ